VEADTKARASDKGSQSYDCEVAPMTTVNCRATIPSIRVIRVLLTRKLI
jgi:hypothetical protein